MPQDKEEWVIGVYCAFVGEVFSYCARRLVVQHLAEDAASEVFLRLVEQYQAVQGKTKMQIRNWLYGTASNVIAAHLRNGRHQSEVVAGLSRMGQTRLDAGPEGNERLDWPVLHQAIGRLKPQQQEVIFLRYFQELEPSAIAQALGLRQVTVRVRLLRAVRRLKRELEKPFGGIP